MISQENRISSFPNTERRYLYMVVSGIVILTVLTLIRLHPDRSIGCPRTVERDQKNQKELKDMGWNVILVWECELRDLEPLANRLKRSILREYDNAAQTESSILMAAEKKKGFRKG
ncbi:MAG: hypothetical protein M0Q01_06640 [Syntrophales bacterium]|jgi:hypothetical protein|nr:hypothetical protein [Syntrophales bacterium]